MIGVEILAAATAGLVGFGALESVLHQRRLKRIRTRVHVSGTRGKSSVTRLIASGLRYAAIRTAAKTTGTLARMILPDGREVPVFRPQGANIIEQRRIVRVAAALGVEALVVECMALQPWLHWLSENKFVRATHGVITNVRADHLDVMGPSEEDVARCLAGMIPVNGLLFTAERRHLGILREAAKDRKTEVIAVTDADLDAVSDADLARFSYGEHRENVALSLKVLDALGVGRARGMAGMWTTRPDPGALCDHQLDFFGRRVVFVNAFAANDPESTETIWRAARVRYPDVRRTVAVFNLRADRPTRTLQLARESRFWREADAIVLMGTGAYLFARVADKTGMDVERFLYAESGRAEEVFEQILGVCGRSTLVVGMGNIAGPGFALARFFQNRAVLEEERTS